MPRPDGHLAYNRPVAVFQIEGKVHTQSPMPDTFPSKPPQGLFPAPAASGGIEA